MFTKLTNKIGKIKYALYGVKLNAQNFILSHTDDTLVKNARHQSSAALVHRHHELGRPAATFLTICGINDASDKWLKRLCVGVRVKNMKC